MHLPAFIHETRWSDLPAAVQSQAVRCLLDTLGAGIAGMATETSRIIHDFAVACFGGNAADLWQDGCRVSAAGAALANGMTIDALDIHDGFSLCKGHAGAAVVPACLATAEIGPEPIDGRELLASLAVGYEVALRAGMCLHGTAAAYHSSGSWNALGCAAITARRLRLSSDQTLHALAIAEYHGPRSPIMRCVEHPTMLKDGSGWGAMTGVMSAQLAATGFTGRPAETVESDAAATYWSDLGARWRFLEMYFKPHAVCRWAQPAVEAALQLQSRHRFEAREVSSIEVTTFFEATRLGTRRPATSDEAQYSLPFSVAAALVHGELGPDQLTGDALCNAHVLRLIDVLEMRDCPDLNALFPRQRRAHVRIALNDGRALEVRDVEPRWDAEAPPTDAELIQKFRRLTQSLTVERANRLEELIWNCSELTNLAPLSQLLALPSQSR